LEQEICVKTYAKYSFSRAIWFKNVVWEGDRLVVEGFVLGWKRISWGGGRFGDRDLGVKEKSDWACGEPTRARLVVAPAYPPLKSH
jgi:hypothetical protein